jgi:hypothetical protein
MSMTMRESLPASKVVLAATIPISGYKIPGGSVRKSEAKVLQS